MGGKIIKEKLGNFNGKIYTIDATRIAMETIGKNFPNTALLAAVVKITNLMSKQELESNMLDSFKHKFAKKPEVIDGNMKALEMALKEVTNDNKTITITGELYSINKSNIAKEKKQNFFKKLIS